MQAKGHDTSRHVLACFGGAGGQHACAIARSLGMKVVLIHRYSGILSAYGMALADVVHEEQETCSKEYQRGIRQITSHYFETYNMLCNNPIGEIDGKAELRNFVETSIPVTIPRH